MKPWGTHYKTGTAVLGPVSSETSTLLSATLVLGGFASAALGKGLVLEIELQMVFVAVVSFSILELGTQKVCAYFEYIKAQHKQHLQEFEHQFDVLFMLVRAVVLVLQIIILLTWSATMEAIDTQSKVIHDFIIGLAWTYIALRGIMLLMQILRPVLQACVGTDRPTYGIEIGHFITEFVFTLVLVSVLIISVYTYTIRGNPDHNYEQNMLKYDKVLFRHMHSPKANTACEVNFKGSTLLSQELEMKDDATKLFLIDEDHPVYRKAGDAVNAVDLKVYYWTRKWRQHAASQYRNYNTDPDIYYCSAGFERHWGTCHNYYHDLPNDVQEEVVSHTSWEQIITQKDVCIDGIRALKKDVGGGSVVCTTNMTFAETTSMPLATPAV